MSIDEIATILNALRFYCEHNEPHEKESVLITRFLELAEAMKRHGA